MVGGTQMSIFIFDLDGYNPAFCSRWSLLRVSPAAVVSVVYRLFLVVRGHGLMRRHGIQPIQRQINSWTSVVLPAVYEPLEDGDNDDDNESSNAVVWIQISWICKVRFVFNLLMLLPVSVLEGGKTKSTVVRMIYARETCIRLVTAQGRQVDRYELYRRTIQRR